jgi:hypothetical protein
MGKQRVVGRTQAGVRYAMMVFPPDWERQRRQYKARLKIKTQRKRERDFIKKALDGS